MKTTGIIGIAGTNGSGKDTIGELLAKKHGYLFVSVTELLRDECRARGLSVERKNLRTISAEWRVEGGLGALVDKANERYQKTDKSYSGLAMASLRNPGEADRIHELGGMMIWVDADPKVRYERIRSANRGRHGEDGKTYEEFLAEEHAEMYAPPGSDATALSGAAVKTLCDVVILNDATPNVLEHRLADIFKSQ